MANPKPVCHTVMPWLQSNLGKRCLGALTGCDYRALTAAIHIVELYSYCPEHAVARAFGGIVCQMQPSTQYLAYHAIAHIMNWEDRAALWTAAGLPTVPAGKCSFEPGGPCIDLAKKAA